MLVHYTVFVDDDGLPDFKVVHERNRLHAMKNWLCNLCGQRLEPDMVFIGGPACEDSRLFIDGPMHEECARYAISVCPYLQGKVWDHSKVPSHLEGKPQYNLKTIDIAATGRPKKMGVFYSSGYRRVLLNNSWVFLSDPFMRIDWSLIPEMEEKSDEAAPV
jgi:hypothetical protein